MHHCCCLQAVASSGAAPNAYTGVSQAATKIYRCAAQHLPLTPHLLHSTFTGSTTSRCLPHAACPMLPACSSDHLSCNQLMPWWHSTHIPARVSHASLPPHPHPPTHPAGRRASWPSGRAMGSTSSASSPTQLASWRPTTATSACWQTSTAS